ncbi:hypothetical protein [Fibrella arboris]|uniref:hypothetical protein n=1 Tax=Fibrella arboris TaxID=3242486 RepID=UPI003520CDEA
MKKVLSQAYLYDGPEQELYETTFRINLEGGDSLRFSPDDVSEYSLLSSNNRLLPDDEVRSLTVSNKLKSSSFVGELLNVDLLPVYIGEVTSAISGNRYLVVSANGEKQPMRFFFVIEGVWLLE